MFWRGYPQPWRGWLQALTALIVALIIVQWVTRPSSWVLFGVVLGLIAIQLGLALYARNQS